MYYVAFIETCCQYCIGFIVIVSCLKPFYIKSDSKKTVKLYYLGQNSCDWQELDPKLDPTYLQHIYKSWCDQVFLPLYRKTITGSLQYNNSRMDCCSSTANSWGTQQKKISLLFKNPGVSFVHVPLAQKHIHVPLFYFQTNVGYIPPKGIVHSKSNFTHLPLATLPVQMHFLNHVTLLEFLPHRV